MKFAYIVYVYVNTVIFFSRYTILTLEILTGFLKLLFVR